MFTQKIASRYIIAISLSASLSVLAVQSWLGWVPAMVILALGVLGFYFTHLPWWSVLLFVGVSCGFMVQYQLWFTHVPTHIVHHIDSRGDIVGAVREVSTSDSRQHIVLEAQTFEEQQVNGLVRITLPLHPKYREGEHLRVDCSLKRPEPFETFAYDRWLASQKVFTVCHSYQSAFVLAGREITTRTHVLDGRRGVENRISRILHEPYAGLARGLLLGQKALPAASADQFRAVGLTHIIAASGQNIQVVSVVLFTMIIRLGWRRQEASWFVLAGITAYVVAVGADAAIVRAGIMGAILIVGRMMGRQQFSPNVLLVAAVGMLLLNPTLLRDDLGFQLSFAATAGILWLEPYIACHTQFLPKTFGIREALSTSMAAQITTTPILILSLGELSLMAPLANLLILPLVTPIMFGAGVLLMVSVVSLELARYAALPVVGLLKTLFFLVESLASLPLFLGNLSMGYRFMLLGGNGLLAMALLNQGAIQTHKEVHMRWGVIGLLLCCLFAIPWPHHGLTFWMFAVGQGDAMSLQFPEGKRWVIDGGPNTVLLEKIGRQLPWYEWGLDTVVMTHADQDHITAFYELGERYDVTRWVIPDKATPMAQHIRDTGNGEVIQVRAGDDLSVGDVSIKVLGPEHLQKDRNANSVVLYLEYGEGNLLLTGDAGVEEENAWFKQLGTVDVLKAGHHGSHTSTSWELLQVTQPDIALISAGKENRHGHPHGIVVRRLEEIGAKILQTNKHGDIQMHFDGGEPRVGQTKNNPL